MNLCDVVQDVVRSSQRLGQQKNITIQLSLDTPVYIIEGDYGRLRQMLLIFWTTASNSPEQSKIEVTLLGSRLTVTDHGCGVKQEELPHVFDRFIKRGVKRIRAAAVWGWRSRSRSANVTVSD